MCYRQGDLASLVADKKSCVSEGEGLPGIYDMMKKERYSDFWKPSVCSIKVWK